MEREKFENKKMISYYILMAYIIFVTDSMFFHLNSNSKIVDIAQYSLILLVIILIFIVFMKNIRLDKQILIILGVIISLLLSMLITSDFTGGYIIKISVLLAALLICFIFDSLKMIKAYVNLMRIVAIVSLICFLIPEYITSFNIFPKIITPSGQTYINAFFTNIPLYSPHQMRNWGPFWEPGVYQAYLNIALFFVLFIKGIGLRKKFIDIVIFSTAIVSTMSTTGIIALPILLIALLLNRKKEVKRSLKFFIVLLISMGLFYLILSPEANALIFEKLSAEQRGNYTLSSRLYSFFGVIQLSLQNPIFGIGPNNVSSKLAELAGLNSISLTNTITVQLASFGFVLPIFYLVKLYNFFSITSSSVWVKITLFLWILIILMTENYTYSLFFSLLIFLPQNKLRKNQVFKENQN